MSSRHHYYLTKAMVNVASISINFDDMPTCKSYARIVILRGKNTFKATKKLSKLVCSCTHCLML